MKSTAGWWYYFLIQYRKAAGTETDAVESANGVDMVRKEGKWAKQIIALQKEDGTWGLQFHCMAVPSGKYPLTTEQALRRLMVLGFDKNDEPVRRSVDYMTACLRGERKVDDSWEKSHNWPLFTELMLASWVRVFEPDNDLACALARRWAAVIEKAFERGEYDHDEYVEAYISQFKSRPKGGREIDFSDFYHISLLKGMLTPKTESLMLDHVLSKPRGIYYIYPETLITPPDIFASRKTSWYMAALELLSGYGSAKKKLGFAVDWINENRDAHGQWDLGAKANDGVYFPLSDSWRSTEKRKADCTERIAALLQKTAMA